MKIALVGKARSGKDTVADFLVGQYGFTEYKFSKGIRDVINLVRGEDAHKNRRELQEVGQGLRRALGEDIWVNYTLTTISQDSHVVISDCRQPNEAKRLRSEGYLLVGVESDEEVRVQRMLAAGDTFTREDLNHETEQISIECDRIINNNGSLEDLYKQVRELVANYTHTTLKTESGVGNG